MEAERRRQTSQLYHAALLRAVPDRAAFVREACGGDVVVQREVESLLALDGSAQNFLNTPAADAAARVIADLHHASLIGRQLGVYHVDSLLGAGGMGEVYRARDTKLGRDVAIKILPRLFVNEPERLARFEREARMLASLNHPHIGAIYGLETVDGIPALVLELIEGPTLTDRLASRPLPMRDALTIAVQIADALEAAHEKGIVHRDLKPANVKITPEGTVKVLDFGLAKTAPDASGTGMTDSPTATIGGTREGAILGTAAYMSPEQARGNPVDKRTDIWAFGCVLFEMLAGASAFAGATMTDTLAAIIEREPSWATLPDNTPATIRRLLQRCLEKDPRRRLHDIADARIELDDVIAGVATLPVQPDLRARRRGWILATALAAMTLGAVVAGTVVERLRPHAPVAPLVRFTAEVADGSALGPQPSLAISPDGRRIAYVAVHELDRQLYVRDVDGFDARALPGTDAAAQPFFSADGEWLGFFANGKLKKVRLTGGPVITVAEAAAPRGGAWTPDGRIIFAPEPGSPLLVVSAEGGTPRAFTTLDRSSGESSHRWPHVSPGGDIVVYGAGPSVTGAHWDEATHVVAQSLESGVRRVVAPRGTYPRFAPDGHLLYVQDGTLYAMQMTAADLATSGRPFPVINLVAQTCCGGIQFDIARTGSIVYAAVPSEPLQPMVWIDRRGGSKPVLMPPARYVEGPRVSPDGTRIAVSIAAGDDDVWVYDIARNTSQRLTFGGINLWPKWTPDGTRIAYANPRTSFAIFYVRNADGGDEQELSPQSQDRTTTLAVKGVPGSWSPDGTVLSFSGGPSGILMWSPQRGGEAKPFFHAVASEGKPAFSPGGHAVAYVTNESGRNEIAVRPYPGTGTAVQVSVSGGDEPMWARNGRELFFRRGDAMLSVEMAADGTSALGLPRQLFSGKYAPGTVTANYDVSADGQRFLMIPATADDRITRFNVVLQWSTELSRLAPATH